MSFDYFHPYCMCTQKGLFWQLQTKALEMCCVPQYHDGTVTEMTRLKYCVFIVNTQICKVIVATESVWQNCNVFIPLQDGNNQSARLYLFL